MDDEKHFRPDDQLLGAFREAVNVVVTKNGVVRTRPEFTIQDAGFENIGPIIYYDPDSYIYVVAHPSAVSSGAEDRYVYVFVNPSAGEYTVYQVNLDAVSSWTNIGTIPFADNPLHFCVVGNALYVSGTSDGVYVITDTTIAQVTFYKELTGLVHYGLAVELATGGTFASAIDSANAKFGASPGDIIVATNSGVVVGTAVAVAYNGDMEIAAAVGTLYLKECTGSFLTADKLINQATGDTYAKATCVAAETNVFVKDNGLNLEQLSAADTVRLLGADYTINIVDDFSFTLNESFTSGSVSAIRIAKIIDGSSPNEDYIVNSARAITFHKGRLVLAGPIGAGAGVTIPLTRVWFSAAYDPFVIRPAPQLNSDAAQPIEVDLFLAGADEIYWVESGDSLFFGVRNGIVGVEGDVYALPEGLPKFRFVSDKKTSWRSARAQYDGRIIFQPRNGGSLEEIEYDFSNARFNSRDVADNTSSKFNIMSSVAVNPKTFSDPVDRIFAVNTQSNFIMCGARFGREKPVAWTKFEPPSGYRFLAAVQVQGEIFVLVRRADGLVGFLGFDNAYNYADLLYSVTDDGYFMDLRQSFTGAAALVWNLGADWRDKYVYVLARYGTDSEGNERYLPMGHMQTADTANATITLSAHATGVTGYTKIIVGLCPEAYIEVAKPVVVQDEKGAVVGRPHRVVQVTPEAYNTRQMTCMDTKVFPEIRHNLAVDLPRQSGGGRVHRMSLWRDLAITAAAVAPYSFTLRSMTVRVAL